MSTINLAQPSSTRLRESLTSSTRTAFVAELDRFGAPQNPSLSAAALSSSRDEGLGCMSVWLDVEEPVSLPGV